MSAGSRHPRLRRNHRFIQINRITVRPRSIDLWIQGFQAICGTRVQKLNVCVEIGTALQQ